MAIARDSAAQPCATVLSRSEPPEDEADNGADLARLLREIEDEDPLAAPDGPEPLV